MSDLRAVPPSPSAPDRIDGRPLAGIVVWEFGHSVAAPYGGQVLADLGARVVKVEKPEGDDARRWGPPFVDGASATFAAVNRGKESVTCHLRDPEARERLIQAIVAEGDVVLQNLRPGQADALGLGAEALRARKPSLVYCNVGAFGARGPLARQPGYDPLMQAFGGIMSVVGEPGWPAVRVGPSIVDIGTAMWGVLGIVSALLRRKETGEGATVDVSLFETSAAWMTMHSAQYLASGELPRKVGSGQVGIAPYRAYRAADGELVVAAGSDKLFKAMSAALGHPDWPADPRFASNPERVQRAALLDAMIEDVMREHPVAHWQALLDTAGVPCAPVQDVRQMLDHPQTRALGLLEQAEGASIPMIGLPLSFDGQRPRGPNAAPALGAHTAAVLGADTPAR